MMYRVLVLMVGLLCATAAAAQQPSIALVPQVSQPTAAGDRIQSYATDFDFILSPESGEVPETYYEFQFIAICTGAEGEMVPLDFTATSECQQFLAYLGTNAGGTETYWELVGTCDWATAGPSATLATFSALTAPPYSFNCGLALWEGLFGSHSVATIYNDGFAYYDGQVLTQTCGSCNCDANNDGGVTTVDVTIANMNFGTNVTAYDDGDCTGNGHVNTIDINQTNAAFGTLGCCLGIP